MNTERNREMKEALRTLDLGNSVAEFEESLEEYFVENEAYRALINDKADIVAGDKGTGKTAIYRVLQARYKSSPELRHVEVLAGFNPVGNPIFQRLVHKDPLTEGQYAGVWKTYFLSLIGNWILEIVDSDRSEKLRQLDQLLEQAGLRVQDDQPTTIFGRIVSTITRWLRPTSAETSVTWSEAGIPVFTGKFDFADQKLPEATSTNGTTQVRHEDALRLLNDCLDDVNVVVWLAMDRLDEAFQGFAEVEKPALRALLRTYLDLLEFKNIRLKLFLRRDLFRRIVGTGFVNLTHLNAKKVEIIWEEKDLLSLLCRRIRERKAFLSDFGCQNLSDEELFYRVFPRQIDIGDRKPTAWNWIMSRIRDGNNVKPPRNLIDLASKARAAQLRREEREPRTLQLDKPLLEAESVRQALSQLSEQRVEDTLIAEAGQAAPLIEAFRGSKSEHNRESIRTTLDVDETQLDESIKLLCEFGFFEKLSRSYKIPMLYRDGLGVTQGKAF